jgi:hypothetical protein
VLAIRGVLFSTESVVWCWLEAGFSKDKCLIIAEWSQEDVGAMKVMKQTRFEPRVDARLQLLHFKSRHLGAQGYTRPSVVVTWPRRNSNWLAPEWMPADLPFVSDDSKTWTGETRGGKEIYSFLQLRVRLYFYRQTTNKWSRLWWRIGWSVLSLISGEETD